MSVFLCDHINMEKAMKNNVRMSLVTWEEQRERGVCKQQKEMIESMAIKK